MAAIVWICELGPADATRGPRAARDKLPEVGETALRPPPVWICCPSGLPSPPRAGSSSWLAAGRSTWPQTDRRLRLQGFGSGFGSGPRKLHGPRRLAVVLLDEVHVLHDWAARFEGRMGSLPATNAGSLRARCPA